MTKKLSGSLLAQGVYVASAASLFAAAPVAHDDVIAAQQDVALQLDYLHLNDKDDDGDALTVLSVGTPLYGTLTPVGANHYQYTPASGFTGRDSFTYVVSDGNGGTDTATVTISVNATVDMEGARNAILANVATLADPTQPGYMTAWGPTAFSVSNYSGEGEDRLMVAASTLGAGKVIAMPDHQWLNMNSYGGDASTGNFYKNGVAWLSGSSSLTIKIVTLSSGVQTWLQGEGYTNVVLSSTANLSSDLSGASVLIPGWLGNNATQATLDTVGDYVRAGGGLFLCDYSPGYSWWWGKQKYDIPGNKLLREAGIYFVENGYSGGVQNINRGNDHVDFDLIESVFTNPGAHTQNEKDLAVGVMQKLIDSLHPDDIAYARLVSLFGNTVAGITPTEANPVTDSFETTLLDIECSLLAKLDPAEMTAHRAALPVSAAAPRVTNATFTAVSPPAGHSTKTIYTPFYAAPGELVTVNVPAELAGIGLKLRTSHLRSGSGGNNYPVMPKQIIDFNLDATQVQIANPHGGLIQIIVPSNTTWTGDQIVTVTGAVEAPYFKLGETTDAEWVAGIRDRGTPFGVLDSPEATLVIDSDMYLRTLSDPQDVMTEWDYFCGKVREFYAYDAGRQLPVHHDYYAAGGVSTYPQSYGRGSNITNAEDLQSSSYALTLHEYGHICDSGNIIFYEFGETSPNMGGKWMQEVHRKYSWKQELTVGRINNYFRMQADDLWNHYNHYAVDVKGTPFDLLSDEFGPALIKDSVAALTAASGLSTSQDKIDAWATELSSRTGYNMTDFFASWQLVVSASAQTNLSQYADWMPVERVAESLTVEAGQAVVFNDPSSNDFSYDGGLTLTGVGQPSNGVVASNGDGTYTYTPNGGFTGSDSFTYTVTNATGNVFTSTIEVKVLSAANNPKLAVFDGFADGSGWTTINLDKSYSSMVVVAQPVVGVGGPAIATRIRNASGSSFEVRLDRIDGSATPVGATAVRFLVVEEGVYNEATHGIKMEAVKFNSSVTDVAGSLAGESRALAYQRYDHYYIPTVFGQVMTSNDANWSAFWYRGGSNSISVGKHVGEDPNTTRANETIGYIVMEAGSYQFGDYQIQVGSLGADGYDGLSGLSASTASHNFERFPRIDSAIFSADITKPWGGSDDGDEGFVTMQSQASGDTVKAYLVEDSLGDAETAPGSKGGSYLIANYTGASPIAKIDAATSLDGGQTLISVLDNDVVSGVPMVIVTQPANGAVVVNSDGTLTYTPNAGFTGLDAFTYTVDNGVSQVTAPVSVNVITPNASQAGIVEDRFNGISGGDVASLTSSANYPDSPSSTAIWTSVDSGTGTGDSYGRRVYGVVVPPTTGDYTFWIASDDHSELWLSSDNTSQNVSRIAYLNGWTGYQSWGSGSQQSAAVTLEAGKAYYIEVLHKEGGGGDHVAVAWQGPGISQQVLANPYLHTAGETAPTAGSIANVSVNEDSADTVIDLSSVFTDGDPGDSVSVSVHGNTNPDLVSASIVGNTLTLSYPTLESGAATITVRGTDRINALATASFTVTVNDANPDSDGDGLTDSWEVAHFGSIAAQDGSGDADGDGLSNAGELAAGTDPNNPDSDGDGYSDNVEVVNATDPNDNQSVPTQAPLVYWSLDDGSGATASDASGWLNDGQLSGGTAWTGTAVTGGGASFDGVDDRITAEMVESNLGTFTVAFWVKNAAAGQSIYDSVFCNHTPNAANTFQIDMGNGFQYRGTQTVSFGAAPVGEWVHLAVVSDGTDTTLYYNGVPVQTMVGVNDDLFDSVNLGVNRNEGNFFQGEVDEFYLFEKALTQQDLLDLTGITLNAAPVATDSTFSVSENAAAGTSVGTVSATDPDAGDTLAYSITAGNGGGEFAINSSTGEITTTTALDYEAAAQYVLTVVVSDGSLTDTATITVDVTNVNEAPVANGASGNVNEDAVVGTTVATVTSTDPDAGDSATYAITAGNDGSFAIDSSTGVITTAAGLDYETTSSYTLTVEVTDGGGLTDTASVGIAINDVANDDSDSDGLADEWEIANFGSVSATDGASDSDGDGLTNAEEQAIGGNPNSGDSDSDGFADVLEVTVGTDLADAQSTPDSTYSGLHSWWNLNESAGATTALDNSGSGFHASVNDITFNGSEAIFDGVNDGLNAGTAAAILGTGDYTVSAKVKTAAGFSATGTVIQQRDPGGTGYLGEYMLNVNANGTVTYFIYNNGYQVNLTTTTTVNDGNWHHIMAVRSGATVTVYIDGVQAAQGSGTVQELLALSVAIGYDHRDNNKYFNGSIDDVRVYNRAVGNQEFYVNEAPAASDATFSVNENAAAGTGVGTVIATDPGDSLSYAIIAGNAGGEFAIDAGTGAITTTTALDYETASQYVLTVEVTDSGLLTDTATITVNVNNVNEAPVANDTSGSVAEDAAVGTSVVTVTSSDVDAGDSRSYAITSGNLGGAFAINAATGEITTASALDYETTNGYLLTVTVTDAGGLTDTALVDVAVSDVADVVTTYSSDAEVMVTGFVLSGSYVDTQVSNNVYEVLQEDKTSGKPSSRVSSLEHTWSFDIGSSGALVELSVEAYHSANSEGDDFVFAYSTDGIIFTDLITVTKTSDDNVAQTAALPAGVSGTVYIRVTDTDRTVGNGNQDTITIDHLNLQVTR